MSDNFWFGIYCDIRNKIVWMLVKVFGKKHSDINVEYFDNHKKIVSSTWYEYGGVCYFTKMETLTEEV